MSQVQFFLGTYDKLQKTRLQDGSIYFVPSQRRLYIDTATRRIPVTGSAGITFYVQLPASSWINNT